MKTRTNKELVKEGFTSEMIGKVLEYALSLEKELFHDIQLTGDEESTIIYTKDFKDREYEMVIYDEKPQTIYMNTIKIDDENYVEKNRTWVKSIGSLMNKMIKMATY